MKKGVLYALAIAGAVAAVGTGATLALFSDTQASRGDLAAGRLCITAERNDGEPVPGPMFYVTAEQGATPSGKLGLYPTGVWAPGDSATRTLTVYNPASCSSQDAWLTSVQAELTEGIPNQYEAMADVLHVTVSTPWNGTDTVVGEGSLREFLQGSVPIAYPDGSKIPVYLGSNRHFELTVTFLPCAGNEYQDKTLVVDFLVNGEQQKNNPSPQALPIVSSTRGTPQCSLVL